MKEQIVPRVRELGGEAEIVDIKETLVYCRFPGIEPDQAGTTRMLAEQALKDAVDQRIRVVMV
jgi:Fe-S cluster biogenesis protein NfuA